MVYDFLFILIQVILIPHYWIQSWNMRGISNSVLNGVQTCYIYNWQELANSDRLDYTQLPYSWNKAGSIDTMSTFKKEQFTGFAKFHKQHRLVASHIDQNKLQCRADIMQVWPRKTPITPGTGQYSYNTSVHIAMSIQQPEKLN